MEKNIRIAEPIVTMKWLSNSWKRKGLLLSIDCSHTSYGGLCYSKVVNNPVYPHDEEIKRLFRLQRKLREEVQEYNNSLVSGPSAPYTPEEFEIEIQSDFDVKNNFGKVFFIDGLWKGVACKSSAKTLDSNFFRPRYFPHKVEKVLSYFFDTTEIQKIIGQDLLTFEEALEFTEQSAHLDSTAFIHGIDLNLSARQENTIISEALKPVLINYDKTSIYTVSNNFTYFDIGRPYWWLVLIGDRKDKKREISVFDGCNEF